MKNVLILGYKDTRQFGHAPWLYKTISSKCNARLMCYLSLEKNNDILSFCNANGNSIDKMRYWVYRFSAKVRFIINNLKKQPGTDEYCFLNSTRYFAKNAKQVLKKAGFKPEMIIVCLYDGFISPKTIHDLYLRTKAHIVVLMCDPNIMTGGCHFPNDCIGYQTNCKSCPALKNGRSAEILFKEKLRYLKQIPLTIVGSSYDLQRAKLSPFLQEAKMLNVLNLPTIPFVKNKIEARLALGLPENDFIILAGGGSLTDKRKGFRYIFESLNLFARDVTDNKRVSLLLLGNDQSINIDLDEKIKIIRPGFLDLNSLFMAFYASDIFCSCSIDDTGPTMLEYSIECGIPAISFSVGMALDLVLHKKTGFIADFKSNESVKEGIKMFYDMKEDERQVYSENCKQLCADKSKEEPWYDKILRM